MRRRPIHPRSRSGSRRHSCPSGCGGGGHRSGAGTAARAPRNRDGVSGVGCAAAVPSEAPPNIEHMFVEQGFSSSGGTTPASADSITNSVETMPLPEVEREICELAAHINAATCHWLTLAAEFDRRGGHEEFGSSPALRGSAWRCSITPRAAREQLRVARCLRALPRITAAFRRGSLSYSKVRALTRVAEPAWRRSCSSSPRRRPQHSSSVYCGAYRGALEPDAASMRRDRRHLATRWRTTAASRSAPAFPPTRRRCS